MDQFKTALRALPVKRLKEEVSKYNKSLGIISGYSKMSKEDLITEMSKHQDKFTHLMTVPKKEAPKKEAPKKEAPKPTPKMEVPKPTPKMEVPKQTLTRNKVELMKLQVEKDNFAKNKEEKQMLTKKINKIKKEIKKETVKERLEREDKEELKKIKQKIEEKKFVVEPKKEVVKDIIKAPEVIEKVGKFSYDKNYFTELDKIAKTDRLGNNQEKIQMKNNLMNLQFSNDLFTTPQECINSIFNDILEHKLTYLNDFNILEPSAGTGMFIRHIIDLNDKLTIKNLDANEYSPDLVKILKEKTKISNVYNKDFLNFKQDKEYQLIIMNPPYSQYIDGKNENKAYLFHLVKAMLLKSGWEKQIYIICPELPKDFNYNMDKAIAQRIAKKFNLKYDKDEGLELPFYQIEKIGECSGFIKYAKGRTTKMNHKFYMYNLVVRD